MIKSSLRSAGMTECLINFKYVMFGQPNQMDGKYCLSWQTGRSINFVLFVLVVASTGRLAPIITFVLVCNRSFFFYFILRLQAGSFCSLVHGENTRTNIFFWERRSVLPEAFINPAHVRFLEPPSIFPFQQPLPRLSASPTDQCLRLLQVPLPWAARSGKHPAV